MRRFAHRAVTAMVLAVVLASAVAGCGGDRVGREDGAAPIATAGVLRVGTEGVYPPYSFHDPAAGGALSGYDVDVARAVGEKLGVDVEFVETSWDSIFAALEADRFDVVANEVTITEERQARYDLSDPYSESRGVLVTRADDPSITGLADLAGRRAAQSPTSNWADVARGAGAEVVAVDGFTQAISALRDGRVDAVVNDSLTLLAYRAEQPDAPIRVVDIPGETSEQGFAARKDSGYLPELNTALTQLRDDGTLAEISRRYLGDDISGGSGPATGGASDAPVSAPSAWALVADNLWPLARAAITATVPLTLISFAVGLVIAFAVALARLSPRRLLSGAARFYISLIRGTPLLVQLFIVFFALPQIGVRIDPFPAAIIAFSLNVGGYAAEIIRAAITSIPRGQWEAAATIGLTHAATLRRIIVPQAARVAVPPLSNTLISLVKDTSLASTILVTELFRTAQNIAAPTFEFFALYGTAALYYWVICLVLSFGQARVEHRLERHVSR